MLLLVICCFHVVAYGGTFSFSTSTRTGSEAAKTTKTNGPPPSQLVASQKVKRVSKCYFCIPIGHNKKTCPSPQAQAWKKLKSVKETASIHS
ncbi:hypothetical protein ACH5RR_015252 [Cinchona calisaya]|uniref:CCHC-type domain-containing protein n=1 Tax=Cinchona calisaya TaxID=153742 RepID=A0ABD2ZT08_9GENT